MPTLGQTIVETRKSKGISQHKLSKLVDYDRNNLQKVETDMLKPSNDLLSRMSFVLGVSFDYLVALKLLHKVSPEVQSFLLAELKARLER